MSKKFRRKESSADRARKAMKAKKRIRENRAKRFRKQDHDN